MVKRHIERGYFPGQESVEFEGYDTAQICLNGHVINDRAETREEHNTPHCASCGAKTITKCLKCDTNIRGHYHVPGVVDFTGRVSPAPAFCPQCGTGYPWTESRLSAAREYIRELERLTENEKGLLSRSLDDIVRDTPNTPVSAARFKQLIVKAGGAAADVLKTILVEIAVESAKRQIWS